MKRALMLSAVLMLLALLLTVSVLAGTREAQHEIYTFRVGSEQEQAYLVKAASYNSVGIRYADAKAEIVYRFDIQNTMYVRHIELSGVIFQQLHLFVSTDGEHYTEVYRWYGEVDHNGRGGLSQEHRAFDLTPFVDTAALDVLYIKIADSYTAGGWGGAIHPSEDVVLDVTYIPATDDELNAVEMAASEHSVPLFGCNSLWGGGFVLDRDDRVAGVASLSTVLGGGEVDAAVRLETAVDASGMDTLELMLYLSDRAIASLPFEGALAISSGQSTLTWTLGTVLSMIDEPVAGWNRVCLPLHLATEQGGAFALDAVDGVAMRWSGLHASSHIYTVKVDSICLTDRQAQERESVIASMRGLLDTADVLDVMLAQGLDGDGFRAFARMTETARRSLDGLTAAQRVVGADFDLVGRVARAEKAVRDHEAALADAPRPEDDDVPPLDEPTVEMPDEPQQPTEPPTQDPPVQEPPVGEPRGMHPMVIVAVAVCVGGALTAAVLTARAKKKR